MSAIQHPTLFEELNRKSVDALTWLAELEESGQARPDQVYIARQALFMALAGLLASDVNELLSASMPTTAPANIEVWSRKQGEKSIVSFLIREGDKRVTARLATIGTEISNRVVETDGPSEATEAVGAFRKHLISYGFKPVI